MGWGIDAMVWVARRVAEIPGAVLRVPAMPSAAFVLMIAGGLWLMLWQTRWRLMGIALIAGGAALAPTLRAPRHHHRAGCRARSPCAGRMASLSAVGATRASFELERWLEHDGARRSPEEAAKAAAFACDGIGCRATVKGLAVAVAQHPAAFAEDCRRAAILISRHRQPARLHGAQDGDRFLRRAPPGHARALHRGGRQHPHRDGGRRARHAAVVDADRHRGAARAADAARRTATLDQ